MRNQIIVTVSLVFLLLSITLGTSCTAQSGNKEQKAVETKTTNTQTLATQKPQSSETTKTIDQNIQKIEHALNSGVYNNNPEMKKKLQDMADRLEADRTKVPTREKTKAAKQAKKGETYFYNVRDEKTGEVISLEMTKNEYEKISKYTGEDIPFEEKKKAINSLIK
ncbi:MAG: hypothetical protein ACPG5B_07405 [Chitinophagales bacterium]